MKGDRDFLSLFLFEPAIAEREKEEEWKSLHCFQERQLMGWKRYLISSTATDIMIAPVVLHSHLYLSR